MNRMQVADKLLTELQPVLLLITLGDQGMLLCQKNHRPFHIPTVAQEVFDVSGAGDTVIASFTLAVAAGASPVEAAIFSNSRGGGGRGEDRHGDGNLGGTAGECGAEKGKG